MEIRTVSVAVQAPAERLFAYLSKPENLPLWATEFCRELRREEGEYRIHTCNPAQGELLLRIEADPRTGVVDFLAGPSRESLGRFPARVIGLPDGGSAFVFTMIRAPGMDAAEFERQHQSLLRELENVRRAFAAP